MGASLRQRRAEEQPTGAALLQESKRGRGRYGSSESRDVCGRVRPSWLQGEMSEGSAGHGGRPAAKKIMSDWPRVSTPS